MTGIKTRFYLCVNVAFWDCTTDLLFSSSSTKRNVYKRCEDTYCPKLRAFTIVEMHRVPIWARSNVSKYEKEKINGY